MDESTVKPDDIKKVIIRDFNKEQDQAFVYSYWRNNSYYSSAVVIKESSDDFFRNKNREIKDILNNKKVRIKIACLQNSPVTIIGYAVSIENILEWIYVKEDYREVGIGTLLLPSGIDTVTEGLTKTGLMLAVKKKLKIRGEKEHGSDRENYRDKDKEEQTELNNTNRGLH